MIADGVSSGVDTDWSPATGARLVLLPVIVIVRLSVCGPSVTLNGVNIDGATNQTFENCTVVIDAQGNVHIQAKGYAVKSSGGDAGRAAPLPPAQAGSGGGIQGRAVAGDAAPARITRRYFIATEQTPPGTQ